MADAVLVSAALEKTVLGRLRESDGAFRSKALGPVSGPPVHKERKKTPSLERQVTGYGRMRS